MKSNLSILPFMVCNFSTESKICLPTHIPQIIFPYFSKSFIALCLQILFTNIFLNILSLFYEWNWSVGFYLLEFSSFDISAILALWN